MFNSPAPSKPNGAQAADITSTPSSPRRDRLRPCQRGWRQLLWAATLGLMLAGQAQADITIIGREVGADVVFSFSGSVNLTGFTNGGSRNYGISAIDPMGGEVIFTPPPPTAGNGWTAGGGGDLSFGTGGLMNSTPLSSTGDLLAFSGGILVLSDSYVSNASLAGSMTFPNATFDTLGIDKTTSKGLALTSSFNILLYFIPAPVGPPPEELSATLTGLPMANALEQVLISASQAVTSDVNNHLFSLLAGDGEEDANGSVDDGVTVGEGDGPEDAIARKVRRSRQWEVFTTANYGNARLGAIGNQAGVQVDSWAPSVGIERHLSRGLALGFAATFLASEQRYTGGLGSLSLEGPGLSAYLTYARKNFWNSLLYNFGSYELSSERNPGFGFPVAYGDTRTYVNAVQYNTGWNFRFQDNTLVTGPFAGIDYLHGSVDSYNETGGGAAALAYGKQTYESLVTRVGWSVTKKLSTSFAEITPQARVSYERQNLTNNGTSVSLINAPFTATGGNQSPGQDYVVAGAGVNFAFNDQLSLLLTYQGQFFRENMQSHFGGVRLSYKF